jgi:hypothetical protein
VNYFTVGLVATAFAAGFITQGWRKDAVISEMVAAQSAAVAAATTEVMNDNVRLQKKKDDALVQANIKAKQNADAAAAAKSQLDWVRDYNQRSAAAINTSTCPSVRDYASTANTVFGECTIALEEMARKADGHALDANTLIKSWPTNKESK